MAKSIKSNSNIDFNNKTKQQIKKYTCGCGKKYTSYPAYSTHRKTKHNNVDIQGSYIPKCQNPKRGRPSYQFVKKNQSKIHKIKNYYQALTVIQLGLLKLNQIFQSKIISQSHQSNQYPLPDDLISITSYDGDHTKCQNLIVDIQNLQNSLKINELTGNKLFIGKLLILFVQLMTTHMTRQPAQALIQFISNFIQSVSANQNILMEEQEIQESQEGQNNQKNNKEMINIGIFNDFFSNQQNKDQMRRLAQQYNLKVEYFVTVSVILSHWIYKLGYCDKVIKLRIPSSACGQSAY